MDKRLQWIENLMYASFAVALVAMLGSLYFSEIMGFIPCEYCWYQRVLMYPLVPILAIAAVRKDYRQSVYVMTLSGIGGIISLYHYTVQKTSIFGTDAGMACGIVPCNVQYINWFGFITIPFLALIAFFLIFVMQFLVWKSSRV